jgi:hypothetical protein
MELAEGRDTREAKSTIAPKRAKSKSKAVMFLLKNKVKGSQREKVQRVIVITSKTAAS